MDFRILGPVEAWDGPNRVAIPGRSQSRLLAALLLNNRRTVSIDWLIEVLWGDGPPATALRQVQNAVAALRRRLAPARDDLIERIGRAYRLNAADDELDERRFDAALTEARRLLAEGAHGPAFDAFAVALELWRGPAACDVTSPALNAAVARLNETRLAAFEEYAELGLRLGRTDRILPPLRRFVDQDPSRQRLCGLLMVALNQEGQPEDALRLFEFTRQRLAEELGIDPSPELRDIHRRILRGDPDPLRPASATLPAPRPRPAQLPADIATFTGRQQQLAALDRLLANGTRAAVVSTISGIGGVGKTALAIHWGRANRDSFPDGQLYINLRGFDEREPLSAHQAVTQLIRALGYPANDVPATLEECATLYRSLLSTRRVLVILDNAHSVEQVRPLLPESASCLTLITSRNHLAELVATVNAVPVSMDTLRPDESGALLTTLLGPEAHDDPALTGRLAMLCGHLPLAIRIAAANLVCAPDRSLSDYIKDLDGDHRLERLRVGNDPQANIGTIFGLSFRALNEDTQWMFLRIGLIPGDDFTASLASTLSGYPEGDAVRHLELLESANLVTQYRPRRYRMHDLVRLFLGRTCQARMSPHDREDVTERLLDWYHDQANATFDEFANAVATCKSLASHPRAWRMVTPFKIYSVTSHNLQTVRRCIEITHRSALAHGDVTGQILTLDALGIMFYAAGDSDTALEYQNQALDRLPRVNDRNLEGIVNGNLGIMLHTHGQSRLAIRHLRHSLRIAEDLGNIPHQQTRIGNLGLALKALGEYRQAELLLIRAKVIAVENNIGRQASGAFSNLGELYLEMGRRDEAHDAARQSLELAVSIGSTRNRIAALNLLAEIACDSGEPRAALDYSSESLVLARRESRLAESVATLCLQVRILVALGNRTDALGAAESARAIVNARHQRSGARLNHQVDRAFCVAYNATAEFRLAAQFGERALEVSRFEEKRRHIAGDLGRLATAYAGLNEPDKATECWTEALAILTELGVPEAEDVRRRLRAAR